MRNLNELSSFRQYQAEIDLYGVIGDEGNGIFRIQSSVDQADMIVIASNGGDWDHLSVSRKKRCPNWLEMEQVKRLFFKDGETAVQYHVPPSDHINIHPNCLHLWRPQNAEMPRPPSFMVGK